MGILLITALLLAILFGIAWVVALKITNFSIVDVVWALSLILPVVIYVIHHSGNTFRDLFLLAMAMFWSLRLGVHLLRRIYRYHPREDNRYGSLRKRWKSRANIYFFLLFLVNAVLVLLLSLPFYFSSQNSASLTPIEYLGFSTFCVALLGESLADRQLLHFLKNHSQNKVCERGLWYYSRHPNYFFESLIWLGIYLFSCGSDLGIYTVHAPIIMVILLTKVTGIPPAEKASLRSKGAAYRKYQQTTSPFIPWVKRTPHS